MKKTLYRVGEGANLDAFPHGTKVGDEVKLTEAQALYERDMGRITPVEEKAAEGAAAAQPERTTVVDESDPFPAQIEAAPLALKAGKVR